MAAMFRAGSKLKDFVKKYGKVALGVHFTVSAASVAGLYIAIKNNVDVESLLEKVGVSVSSKEIEQGVVAVEEGGGGDREVGLVKTNWKAKMAASGGGTIAMAVLANKALFPLRVPITVALTPPIARFLARRKLIQTSVCS